MSHLQKIKLLKKQGHRISSKTKRYLRNTGQLINKNDFVFVKEECELDPLGGIIDVFILNKFGKEYRGSSVCCRLDNFDRKKGFQDAFWDAYKNYIKDKHLASNN